MSSNSNPERNDKSSQHTSKCSLQNKRAFKKENNRACFEMEINIRRSKSTWSKPNLSASLLKLLPFQRPLPLVKGSMDPCSRSPEPWGSVTPPPFSYPLSCQSPIPAHLSFYMSHTFVPSTLFDGQPSVLASSSLHTQITTMLL